MSHKRFDKSKYKVKEVIQNYLSLEKRGRNFWAICPFHDDTNPSLSISEEKNFFKCFSCGASGDAISFIMKKENLSLEDAVFKAHTLLKLPPEELEGIQFDSQEYLFKKQLLKFNEFILEFFENSLYSKDGEIALQHLKEERKLAAALIKKVRLGYAPSGNKIWEALEQIKKISNEYQFINDEFLLKTGIFMKNSNKTTNNLFPIFQNRIIFPIFSKNSEILAFSSRKLDSSSDLSPKYIHSQETALFRKADLLYNLQDLSNLNKEDFIYLFEGFFDLFSMKSINSEKICLALLGSELSINGLKILAKLPSKKIVLALDNDQAGRNATLKSLQKLLKFELNPYILPIEYEGFKDLSELYSNNPSISLPEPLPYIEWIKNNWRELWKEEKKHITDIIAINQIVDFLLSSLFIGNKKTTRIFLFPELNYEFAISQISQIFDLYSLVERTEDEKAAIENSKKKYIEAINLTSIISRSERLWMEKNANEEENCISNELSEEYLSVLEIIEELKKSDCNLNILSKEFSNWETPLLFQYFESYKLIFSEKENSFFMKVKESLEELKDNLFLYVQEELEEAFDLSPIKDFLEIYYCLVLTVIQRTKEYISCDLNMGFPERYDLLIRIDSEQIELRKMIVDVFRKIVSLEKQFSLEE